MGGLRCGIGGEGHALCGEERVDAPIAKASAETRCRRVREAVATPGQEAAGILLLDAEHLAESSLRVVPLVPQQSERLAESRVLFVGEDGRVANGALRHD